MLDNNIKYYLIAGSALGAVRHGGFIPWDDDIDIGMFREDYERFLTICNNFDNSYDIVNFKNAKNCDFCLTRIYYPNTYIEDEAIKTTKLDKRLYFDIFPLDNVPDDSNELARYELKIKKKKNLISRIDFRNYNNPFYIRTIKKCISLLLMPFRTFILKNTEKLMCKYQHTTTFRVCSLCSQYSFKKQVMDKNIYGKPTLHKFENCEFYIPEQIKEYLTTLYGSDYIVIPPENKRRKGHNIYLLTED